MLLLLFSVAIRYLAGRSAFLSAALPQIPPVFSVFLLSAAVVLLETGARAHFGFVLEARLPPPPRAHLFFVCRVRARGTPRSTVATWQAHDAATTAPFHTSARSRVFWFSICRVLLLLLLPVQIEQLEVSTLLTSVYPASTGQSPPSSQTLKVSGPFEYVQHRILSAPAKQRFHVFSSVFVVCCLWLLKGRTRAIEAIQGRDSLDERVSTQTGTSAILLTEVETH